MHTVNVDHPTDRPDLVSYVRPELREIGTQLNRVADCFTVFADNDLAVRAEYLPQEPGERDTPYKQRLGRSIYPSFYRDAIRAFAGLLSNYQIHEMPASMEDADDNVDRRGSSLNKFLNSLDQLVLRDGGAAVLVEMPPETLDEEGNSLETSAMEEIEAARAPWLVPIERQNLINWRTKVVDGREVVTMAVIRTIEERQDPKNAFGTVLEPIYLLLTPGAWQKIRLVRGATMKWEMVVEAEGVTTLPVVPLVWYGATGSQFAGGSLPLSGLADLSIQHFTLRSDLVELIHRLALPVPVRKGSQQLPDGSYPPMVLGPNSGMDLPENGDFKFAELSGSSLAQHQVEVEHVEALMDRSSLSFMYGSTGNGRTATEAVLQGSQVASQVRTLIENKQAMFGLIMKLWTTYMAEDLSEEAGLDINDNLIARPLEAQEVQAYLALFGGDLLSHETTLGELQKGQALSQDIDLEEEIARVTDERKARAEEAMEMMQETGGEDPAAFAPAPNPEPKKPEKSKKPEKE
ncbi:predicted protein [Cyanophage PSS2]|uniref:portal protein n=1 Tax=Cyanophage PSS2 TaxID=658401 RepID=UPI0001B03FEE|nr:portal protein [Cyanophage PSS2]ACT65587.1 hypothetical protein [Cyanophage PSS2]ACY75729.1 predicted protein [Cyanophage PSS2]